MTNSQSTASTGNGILLGKFQRGSNLYSERAQKLRTYISKPSEKGLNFGRHLVQGTLALNGIFVTGTAVGSVDVYNIETAQLLVSLQHGTGWCIYGLCISTDRTFHIDRTLVRVVTVRENIFFGKSILTTYTPNTRLIMEILAKQSLQAQIVSPQAIIFPPQQSRFGNIRYITVFFSSPTQLTSITGRFFRQLSIGWLLMGAIDNPGVIFGCSGVCVEL